MAHVYGKSLAEYMEKRNVKRGKQCYVCSLPPDLRCQIERGWFDKNWPMQAIYEWLRDVIGEQDATKNKLQGHLARHKRIEEEG